MHPPLNKPTNCLVSSHCVILYLTEKIDYHIFAIKDKKLFQMSYLSADSVKLNDWNLINNVLVSELSSQTIFIVLPANKQLPPSLAPKRKPSTGQLSFVPMCQKLLSGKLSRERINNEKRKMGIEGGDCLENFGVMSLLAGDWCQTSGQYNSNDWFVEKGTISGLEAYRVYPPKSRPSVGFGSRHCIVLRLNEKKDHNVYKIENQFLTLVSWVPAEKVQVDGWTPVGNISISQLDSPVVYFALPMDKKLPNEIAPKAQSQGNQMFVSKCQKLLTGFFSLEIENNISPVIK